jgi:hypothetical protein
MFCWLRTEARGAAKTREPGARAASPCDARTSALLPQSRPTRCAPDSPPSGLIPKPATKPDTPGRRSVLLRRAGESAVWVSGAEAGARRGIGPYLRQYDYPAQRESEEGPPRL